MYGSKRSVIGRAAHTSYRILERLYAATLMEALAG